MADPFTIMMVASVAGSALKAGGDIYKGFADSAAYKYQAGVAGVNQKIALQNADYSRAVGEFKAEQSGMKSRGEAGKIKAIQSASGLRADMGSAQQVQESQHMLGESEQNVIRANAAKAAYGHEVEALNFGAQSNLYSMAAKTSKVSGFINAGSSILGGASSTTDKYMQYSSMAG